MNTTTMRGLRTASHFQRFCANPSDLTQKPSLVLQGHLQLRYASSSPSTPLKTISLPPKTAIVNGPLTTLPAPLDLPTRTPDKSLPSHLFATGKAYLGFYKTGVYNIYTNYRLSRDIQTRLSASKTGLADAVRNSTITRSDFQLLYRNWHDMKRVPVFALVLLICGEFTPLVVIALTSVVPWTCRIPRQINSDRQKLEKRRSESFRDLTSFPTSTAAANVGTAIEQLDKWQLRHMNSSLGLSSSLWEWVFGPPEMLLKRRLKKRMEYLEQDDLLISRAGGVRGMAGEEVRMACVERGIDVMSSSEETLRRVLDAWLKSKEKVGMERLLLTRPNVWPVRIKAPEPVQL